MRVPTLVLPAFLAEPGENAFTLDTTEFPFAAAGLVEVEARARIPRRDNSPEQLKGVNVEAQPISAAKYSKPSRKKRAIQGEIANNIWRWEMHKALGVKQATPGPGCRIPSFEAPLLEVHGIASCITELKS